jgi:hypothetical protein
MRTAIFLLAALLSWAPQLPRDRAAVPASVATAVIAGRVTSNVNGTPQPVRRARITLDSEALPRPLRTDADTQGRYQFDKLPAGAYRIRAEKAGFVAQVRDARRAFERPAAFDVAVGQKLSIDLPMVRGAAFEGRIVKDSGEPAVNVLVSALRFSYDANGRRATMVRQAQTDDRGWFRIHSLPAGDYYLEAAADPLDVVRQGTVPGRPLTILARSFFPGAPRIEGGRSLTLAAGQDMPGMDFSVPWVAATSLRGTVLDSSGAPVKFPNISVRVQRVGAPIGEVRGSINPAGNDFSYPAVPVGDFWVMGVTRSSPTAAPEFAATRVTLNGEPRQDVVLTTAKGAVINGVVEVEGGAAPPMNQLQVIAHETDFELPVFTDAAGGPPPGLVAADGTFGFTSLFGPRQFRVQRLPPGWSLKTVSLDGVDVSDTPVDLRGRETPRTLRMVITSRTGSVSGLVLDEAGKPLSHARVVVFSADDRQWGWRTRMVKSVESDGQGRYVIDGLLDGKYHVVAVPFLEEGAWLDATILARLVPTTPPMELSGAAKLTANVVVKP